MSGLEIFSYVFAAVWILQAVWGVQLYRLRLIRRYPILFSYLVISTSTGMMMRVMYALYDSAQEPASQRLYFWLWAGSKPIYWILLFCVLVEVHTRMLEGFRGFERLGQIFIHTALALTGVLFLAMSMLGSPQKWVEFWNAQDLGISVALTLFGLLLGVFAVYFRLEVSNNARLIYIVFAITVSSSAILRSLGKLDVLGASARIDGTVLNSLIYLVCLSVAVLAFSAAGERNPQRLSIPIALQRGMEADLTRSLDSLNQQLIRTLRS